MLSTLGSSLLWQFGHKTSQIYIQPCFVDFLFFLGSNSHKLEIEVIPHLSKSKGSAVEQAPLADNEQHFFFDCIIPDCHLSVRFCIFSPGLQALTLSGQTRRPAI